VGAVEVPPWFVVWVVAVVAVVLDGTSPAGMLGDVEVSEVVAAVVPVVVVGPVVLTGAGVVETGARPAGFEAVVDTGADGVGIGAAVVDTGADGVGIGAAVVVTIAGGVGIGVAAVVVTI
jgi:hypothetical protein